MKAMIEVEIGGFSIPDAVIFVDGHGVEGETVELKLLDSSTLARLCDEFRAAVFTAAGKCEPPQDAPLCRKCGNYT